MFFFVGGITPKIRVLSHKPEICPVCGLAQAYYKRVDYYLNLFFIAVLRVRTGEPFLMCERCERNVGEMREGQQIPSEPQTIRCEHCGGTLKPEFFYCPRCGKKV